MDSPPTTSNPAQVCSAAYQGPAGLCPLGGADRHHKSLAGVGVPQQVSLQQVTEGKGTMGEQRSLQDAPPGSTWHKPGTQPGPAVFPAALPAMQAVGQAGFPRLKAAASLGKLRGVAQEA